jgi:pimeloyl-ACP methyl ester carboxylesterase
MTTAMKTHESRAPENFDVHHHESIVKARKFGEGNPAIVLLTGLGVPSSSWSQVPDAEILKSVMETFPWNDRALIAPALAVLAQVITYDRAGIGESTPPSQARSLNDLVEEFGSVLNTINQKNPVVIVGHSMGGLLAYEFACRFPKLVCGLVLLDSAHPNQGKRFASVTPREQLDTEEEFKYMRDEHPERIDLFNLMFQDNKTPEGQLGNLPMAVISRGVVMSFDKAKQLYPNMTESTWAKRQQIWSQMQLEYAKTSTGARLIQAQKSGHYVHFDEPNLVIEAIRDVWEAAREQR